MSAVEISGKRTDRFFALGRCSTLAAALVVSAALTGLLTPFGATASPQDTMLFPHALTPAFRWSEPIEMKLSGMPVVVRHFVAALTLEQAARAMARHEKQFQRVTTLPGAILLSGVYQDRHWVAQLEAGSGHIKGVVSTLPMGVGEASQNAGMRGFLSPWLTQNARFLFGQSSGAQGRQTVQSIHVSHQPIDAFVGALDRRLAQAGWRRHGAHSWRGQPTGSDDSPSIDVIPVPVPAGVGNVVFVNQSE